MSEHTWQVLAGEEEIANRLCSLIFEAAERNIREREEFTIAVSGGSLVKLLGLPSFIKDHRARSCKWKVFLVDERVVPIDDPENTFGQYLKTLGEGSLASLGKFVSPINEGNLYDPAKAAAEYEALLQDYSEGLDMVILGLGPDGHTASLFPPITKSHLSTLSLVEAVYNSPKPPPKRITLTIPYMKKAKQIVYVALGSAKALTISKILKPTGEPNNWLSPCPHLPGHWLLDSSAATALQ